MLGIYIKQRHQFDSDESYAQYLDQQICAAGKQVGLVVCYDMDRACAQQKLCDLFWTQEKENYRKRMTNMDTYNAIDVDIILRPLISSSFFISPINYLFTDIEPTQHTVTTLQVQALDVVYWNADITMSSELDSVIGFVQNVQGIGNPLGLSPIDNQPSTDTWLSLGVAIQAPITLAFPIIRTISFNIQQTTQLQGVLSVEPLNQE